VWKETAMGYVEFVEINSVLVLFNDRPSLIKLIARARVHLHWPRHDVDIVVGVYFT
jgi:hypothetical protein